MYTPSGLKYKQEGIVFRPNLDQIHVFSFLLIFKEGVYHIHVVIVMFRL